MLLIAALAMLSLRALAPDGYMPGSKDSGLLYELCPSGMPAEIMQALSADSHHHHHGGQANGDESYPTVSAEQCPIGHMLASAVATDTGPVSQVVPDAPRLDDVTTTVRISTRSFAYRSRAPPA